MGFSVSELIIGLISSVSALVVGNSNVVKQPQVDQSGKMKTSIEGTQTSGTDGKIDRSQMGRSFSEGGTATSKRGSSSSSSQNDLVSRGHYSSASDQRNLSPQSQGGSFTGEQQSSFPRAPLQSQVTVGQHIEAQASSGHRPSVHTSSRASDDAISDALSHSQDIGGLSGHSSVSTADSAGAASVGGSTGGSSTSSVQEAASVSSVENSSGLSMAESKLLQDKLASNSTSNLNAAEMNVLQEKLALRSAENKDLQNKLTSKGKLNLSSKEIKALQDKLKLSSAEIKLLQDQLAFHVAKNKELQAALAAGKKPAGQGRVQEETGKIIAEDKQLESVPVDGSQVVAENPVDSEKEGDTRKSTQLNITKLKKTSQETAKEIKARENKERLDIIRSMREKILSGKRQAVDNKAGKNRELETGIGEDTAASVDLNTKLEENRRQQIALQTEIANFKIEIIAINAANLKKREGVAKRQELAIKKANLFLSKATAANKKEREESLNSVLEAKKYTLYLNKKQDDELNSKLEKLEKDLLSLKKEEERFVKRLAQKNDSEAFGTISGTSALLSSKNGKQISSDDLGNANKLLETMLSERSYNNLLSDTKMNRELIKKIGSLDKDQIESLEQALLSEPLPQLRLTKLAGEIDNIISGFWKEKTGKVMKNIISNEVTIDALSGQAGSITSPSLLAQASAHPVLNKNELERDLRELTRQDTALEFKLGLAKSEKGPLGEKKRENFTNEKLDLQKKIEKIKAALVLMKTPDTSLISSGVGGALGAEVEKVTKLAEDIKAEKEVLVKIEEEEESLALQAKSPTKDQVNLIEHSKRLKFMNESRAKVQEAAKKLKEIKALKIEKLNEIKEREVQALALKKKMESEALSQKFLKVQENSEVAKRTIGSNEQAIHQLEIDLAEKRKFYEEQKTSGAKLIELRKLTKESDQVLERIEEFKKAKKSNEELAEQLRITLRDTADEIEKEKQLRIEEQANFEKEKLEAEKAEKCKQILAKLAKAREASDGGMDVNTAIKNSPQKFKKTGVTPVKSFTDEKKDINPLFKAFDARFSSSTSTSTSTTTSTSTSPSVEPLPANVDEETVKPVVTTRPESTTTPEKKTKKEEEAEAAARKEKADLLKSGLQKRPEDFDDLDADDAW